MVKIHLDGQTLEADHNAMIIEVADDAGVYIPRFCYHKKLSIAANCRMCLVEVEGVGKPLPACATPVSDGMKVLTQSQKTLHAQRTVMEFLLANHPLDCPVCDQGGQCELQDLAMGYGADRSQFEETKRSVSDKNIGPLVYTEMTRCIHCTRCVRFGQEVAGFRELGLTGRGGRTEVGTFVEKLMASEVAGNVIDLCPVGALNAKPSAKQGRPWHFTQHEGIAPHDALGANIYYHTMKDLKGSHRVVQVVPRLNEEVNEQWISDRDRFAYSGLNHADRLTQPMIKKKDRWVEVSWEEALSQAMICLDAIVKDKAHGGETIGGLIAPSSTEESLFLFQKLLRGIGSNHIDSRLKQQDFTHQSAEPIVPLLSKSLEHLEALETLWLVDMNLHRECPVLGIRVRQASLDQTTVLLTKTRSFKHRYERAQEVLVSDESLLSHVSEVLSACLSETKTTHLKEEKSLLKGVKPSDDAKAIASALSASSNGEIWIGAWIQSHPHYGVLYAMLQRIASVTNHTLGLLTEGANTAGAYEMGALPHRGVAGRSVDHEGLTIQGMIDNPRKAMLIAGFEPEKDTLFAQKLIDALKQTEFVVMMTGYVTEAMKSYADILLPVALPSEETGTFKNAMGVRQTFQAAANLPGESKPLWKVLRALGGMIEAPGFNHRHLEDVREEIHGQITGENASEVQSLSLPNALPEVATAIRLKPYWPLYASDSIVRRSEALQSVQATEGVVAIISEALANTLGDTAKTLIISQNSHSVSMPYRVDPHMSGQAVLIPFGVSLTEGFVPGEASLQLGGFEDE